VESRYLAEMQQYEADMFVDETGTDRRDCMRKFGYSLRGKHSKSQKLLIRDRRVSAISALSTNGMLDFSLVCGAVHSGSLWRSVC